MREARLAVVDGDEPMTKVAAFISLIMLVASVSACASAPRPEPPPVVTNEAPTADAAPPEPCMPMIDVLSFSRCSVDAFCACPDKPCGVAAYQRYRRVMDTVPQEQGLGFAEYQAEASRMAECSSKWK